MLRLGTTAATHMEIDGNEIVVKKANTNNQLDTLYINVGDGLTGNTYFGNVSAKNYYNAVNTTGYNAPGDLGCRFPTSTGYQFRTLNSANQLVSNTGNAYRITVPSQKTLLFNCNLWVECGTTGAEAWGVYLSTSTSASGNRTTKYTSSELGLVGNMAMGTRPNSTETFNTLWNPVLIWKNTGTSDVTVKTYMVRQGVTAQSGHRLYLHVKGASWVII